MRDDTGVARWVARVATVGPTGEASAVRTVDLGPGREPVTPQDGSTGRGWLPDGASVLVTSSLGGTWALHLVGVADGVVRTIDLDAPPFGRLVVAPDGRSLLIDAAQPDGRDQDGVPVLDLATGQVVGSIPATAGLSWQRAAP